MTETQKATQHEPGPAAEETTGTRRTILHCITEFLPRTQTWMYSQLKWNEDFRHVVLCRRRFHPDEFPWDEVIVRSGAGGIRGRLRDYLKEKDPPERDGTAIRAASPRLVHAHQGWEGYRALDLVRDLRVPLVTTFYGLDVSMLPRRWWWRNRYRELFEAGDMFLAEGPFMRDRLVELGVPQERTRVIALGIDLERIRFRLRQPVEHPVILMAASFREKKGHQYALDAFQAIARKFPGARLEFIGDGPLRPFIVSHIPMDLATRVGFHGAVAYDRYLEILNKASILLAPSVTAENGDTEGGAPVCLLEGQASGIPVVATEHCDIPNVLCPGLRQFLVPERDTQALAESLSSMLENQELWSDLGAQGRKWAEESFDIRTQARKIGDVYRELIS